MNQNQRRRWLIHALLEEMPQYQYPVFPYTAEQHSLHSIAFCCISTGVFRFPPDLAAGIAVQTVNEFLQKDSCVQRVIFNVFKDSDLETYRGLLA